ncbi:hypothetical protein ACFSTC_26230 [Nonomuraea ferruginea]
MHRGAAAAGALNAALQEALTPARDGAPERRHGGRVFRVGDKVTQLRNNYDKGAAAACSTAPSASSPTSAPTTTLSPS